MTGKITLKTLKNCASLGTCDFNFNFFCDFIKNTPKYIDPSGQFNLLRKLFEAQTSKPIF